MGKENDVTDKTYIGKREKADLGNYYYGARWYDPTLGHFLQADTIIPQPGNPLAWNRFAYTLYNPVRYTDPSGHRACADAFDCSAPVKTKYTESEYISYLSAEYGWVINREVFSYREVKVIYETSEQIRNYASSQTGGGGKEWMNEYIRPIFGHNVLSNEFSWVPLNLPKSNVVLLAPGFADSANPITHVIHELGHVLDNANGNRLGAAVWAGGGWADELVRHVGGNPPPVLPRFYNGSAGIPNNLYFENDPHAQDGTAEYFAYTFQYAVTDPKNEDIPSVAIEWLNVKVAESITP